MIILASSRYVRLHHELGIVVSNIFVYELRFSYLMLQKNTGYRCVSNGRMSRLTANSKKKLKRSVAKPVPCCFVSLQITQSKNKNMFIPCKYTSGLWKEAEQFWNASHTDEWMSYNNKLVNISFVTGGIVASILFPCPFLISLLPLFYACVSVTNITQPIIKKMYTTNQFIWIYQRCILFYRW